MSRRAATGFADPARERLLQAGERLFATRVLDQISTTDIANEAGVARGLLFHYFPTKVDFFVEVYRRFTAQVREVQKRECAVGTPIERLRKFVEIRMGGTKDRPQNFLYLRQGGVSAKLIKAMTESRIENAKFVHSLFWDRPPTEEEILLGRAWLDAVRVISLIGSSTST